MTVVYLDPSRVTDQRQGEPPLNRSRTGYGGKIPSSWELQLDGRRWHRVYVMQWSNMGTPYVLVKGKQLLLGAYDPQYESSRPRRDPARTSARRLPVRHDVKEVEYHRSPTPGEIRFGHGAMHYRLFSIEEVSYPGTRILKKWFRAQDDGLRYYR